MIFQSSFVNSLSLTFSASVVSRVLHAVNFIILAKLYSQEQIGEYSIFIAYITIFGVFSLGSCELILPNLKQRKNLSTMIVLLIYGSMIVGVVISFIFCLSGYKDWFMIGVAIFTNALIILSDQIAIRMEQYIFFALANIILPLLFCFGFLLVSFFSISTVNLIEVQVATFLIISFIYSYYSFKISIGKLQFGIDLKDAKELLGKYKNFPKFIAPAQLFNTLAFQLPVLLIGKLLGAAMAAQYSLTLRLCMSPVNIISKAFGKVYYGKVTNWIRSKSAHYYPVFKLFSICLLGLGSVLGVTIYFGYPYVVKHLFGEEWAYSASMAQAFSPLCISTVVVLPLTSAFLAFNEQKFQLKSQIWHFLLSTFSFTVGILIGNIIIGIIIFSFLNSLRNIIIWLRLKKIHMTT
jgi:O-antigen/teichoic acid export membrane protein